MAKETIEKTLSRAQKAAKAKDWLLAYQLYDQVRKRFPSNKKVVKALSAMAPDAVPALLQEAQTLHNNTQVGEAEERLVAAFGMAPQIPKIGIALANTQVDLGDVAGALRTANTLLKQDPDNVEALNIKSHALRGMARPAEAEAVLMKAYALAPDNADTLRGLGIQSRNKGLRKDAEDYFRRAAALTPEDGTVHANLANVVKYSHEEPHLKQMLDLLEKADLSDPEQSPLLFALFKAFHDMGEYEAAFAYLKAGNMLEKARLKYDFKNHAYPYGVSKVFFKERLPEASGPSDLRPVFITGLPRSGTTLMERILSRAEGTQPCGELAVVNIHTARLLRDIFDRDHKLLTGEDIVGLRKVLLEDLAQYSDGSPVLIDKMPLNFRWIGYICAALPEARIVHMSRDPMATAWSLYRLRFAGEGNGFVYDPADIARFMVMHNEMMKHWRALYSDRIVDVDYSELVSDTKRVTQEIAKRLDLPWTEDWLSPEKSKNQATTASTEQVRKPIYKGSDAGWKAYETQLEPMREMLEQAGVLSS